MVDAYRGLYINLDRSTARRQAMQAQIDDFGLTGTYKRFAAIDGDLLPVASRGRLVAGEAGAFRSHTDALSEGISSHLPVHIMEDDALLSAHSGRIIEQAIAAGLLSRFDVLFTDTFVAPDLGMIKVLGHAFEQMLAGGLGKIDLGNLQVIDLSRQNFACLTSYLVAPEGARKILPILHAELRNGPRMPIDLFLRQAAFAGHIRVGLLAPFVTGFRLDEVRGSTIAAGTQSTAASVMVLAVLRYLFFVEHNLELAKSCLAAVMQGRHKSSEQEQLIVQAVRFILSDEFRQF